MNARLRVCALFIALATTLTILSCGDDDSPTGTNNNDTTPPAVSSVTAVDVRHIDVLFSEAVTRASAEDAGNYSIIQAPVPVPAPRGRSGSATGGGLAVLAASLHGDGRTVTITTDPMLGVNYRLSLQNIRDTHGNGITGQVQKDFPGTTVADNTPPQLVYYKPAAGATNVGIAQLIELTFSEPIQQNTLEAGFGMNGPGAVVVTFSSTDNTHFTGTHDPLQKNYTYNLSVSDVLDLSGNAMSAPVEWSFKTTNADDNTPPTLVSSVPANLATNVDVNADLSLTFSEAIKPDSFEPLFTPDVSGTFVWSLDAKTITFTPSAPLAANTQYELAIFPGDVEDLAGNPNTALFTRVFTTGTVLESGSIAGTISGDPNSSKASDPTGGFVAAADAFPFGGGSINVYGATTVAGNNTYTVKYLRDGTYFPLCIKDTSDDGWLDPFLGDAIGLFGIDFVGGDMTPDSVTVVGGSDETGVNFKLYDPTAIYGEIFYEGVHASEFHALVVGLFETAGFDPGTSVPVAGTEAFWPENPFYVITTLEAGPIDNGTYYIGAYMDANDSGDYEPATDPAGLFAGNPPTAINLSNGNDAPNTNILLQDPAPGLNATAAHWTTKPHATWLRNLSKAVREAQLTQQK